LGTIHVHEFTTVDGVIDAPGWTAGYGFTPELGEAIGDLTGRCRAILLGRRTYEMFAPVWSTRTAAEDPGAPFFNDTPKYVVSGTLDHADWNATTVLGPYDAGSLRALKERTDGGIYVSGSGTLVRAMLADGLVDELHLFVYPLAVGSGPRLFPDGAPRTTMSLVGSRAFDNGVVQLSYRPTTG
jgi:dihydrofolate reductase